LLAIGTGMNRILTDNSTSLQLLLKERDVV
jgi:hypothetical protein